eukprot:7490_1
MRDELIGAERQNIDPNDGLILGKRRSRRLTSPIVEIPTKRKKVDEQSSKDGISTDTIRKSPIRKSLRLSAKKSKRSSRKTDADETNTKSKGQKPSTVTRLRRRADSVKGGQSDDPAAVYDRRSARMYARQRFRFGFAVTRASEAIQSEGAEAELAMEESANLSWGEILPDALLRILDDQHLEASRADIILELGMGAAKAALAVFMSFPSVRRVIGAELSPCRYALARTNARALANRFTPLRDCGEDEECSRVIAPIHWSREGRSKSRYESHWTCHVCTFQNTLVSRCDVCGAPKKRAQTTPAEGRTLELRHANMFALSEEVARADIVLMDVKVPYKCALKLQRFLRRMKRGARLLSYDNIETIFSVREDSDDTENCKR